MNSKVTEFLPIHSAEPFWGLQGLCGFILWDLLTCYLPSEVFPDPPPPQHTPTLSLPFLTFTKLRVHTCMVILLA